MDQARRLWNRNFTLLWQGQLFSQIGTQAYMIAMLFWIKHETGSATLMGLVMMVSSLPAVLLGPFAGTFADRHSRRAIIVTTDVLSGVCVLALAWVMFQEPDVERVALPCLFLASTALSVLASFFRPAISAAVPDLVPRERVAAANSLNQISELLATFVGQGAGGVLFRLLGAPVLFLIDGISYLISAFSESFIAMPQPDRRENGRAGIDEFLRDTLVGLSFVWRSTGLRHLFFAAVVVSFFIEPIIVLLPFYVEDALGLSPDWYGYLIASLGLGALLGTVLAGTVPLRGEVRAWSIGLAVVAMSIAFGALGFVRHPLGAVAAMLVAGLLNGAVNVVVQTIVQISTPSEMRGRVLGLLVTLANGLAPIAMGLSGVAADLLDQRVRLIYVACGVLAGLLSVALLFGRELRSFLAVELEGELDAA